MDEMVTLSRRELFKNTSGLLTGCVIAGSPLARIALGRAWAVDLAALGVLSIRRASHVEPDEEGRWWVDLGPAGAD